MPLLNGLELLREIRKMEPGIKIAFSSGDDSVREEALASGCDGFLTKPAGVAEILECTGRLSPGRSRARPPRRART